MLSILYIYIYIYIYRLYYWGGGVSRHQNSVLILISSTFAQVGRPQECIQIFNFSVFLQVFMLCDVTSDDVKFGSRGLWVGDVRLACFRCYRTPDRFWGWLRLALMPLGINVFSSLIHLSSLCSISFVFAILLLGGFSICSMIVNLVCSSKTWPGS